MVWKDVKLPDGKILIPDLVTLPTNVVETGIGGMANQEFRRSGRRGNVIAGTDCGFAQSDNIARRHPSVQRAKLEALVQG